MPRTQIPITAVVETGTAQPAATAGDATNDHYLANANVIVECKNTSGGALDVTFVTPYATPGGVALADNVVNVGAGAVKLVNLKASGRYYTQSGDSDRVWVDVTSTSWELRAYAI